METSGLEHEIEPQDELENPGSIRIARIEREDLPALAALYQQLQDHEAVLERMATALELTRKDSNHIILGATIAGELVGTVLGVVCRMIYGHGRSYMIVDDVVVDRLHRRIGIGRALMKAIEEKAWERDCSCIMLVTEDRRTEALRFYEALGYRSDRYRAFKKSL
ncbi:MAG: GNAT family N-acetyltransferase [Planctomycetota bacterium]